MISWIKHEYESPEGWRKTINEAYYVPGMLAKHKKFFDNFKPGPLTNEQRKAIVVDEDNNYVNAGAGCGCH